ncbi:glycoside hydrolase family 13 protein [Thermophilibacter sp. ET337]|uniref:glycoside hydrolase family 13 protein n=1 Tax=Thermophilibacter sp. ET337 TaxID=2973084 RepID=UPI0021ACA9C3|nr:glycoside hydrolase family 13 protein [Thermophilibacter sp. ET337]MCR8907212.1 glycoside hydrolase family 13 protein [Thermophilibacter sp. ET337]
MTLINGNEEWWKQAVVYQVYPRSFYDANGDGLGDIRGITAHMDYLRALGIDAIWLSPFYPSPLVDGGYDVADYRNVDPRLGTLEDFDEMAAAAHAAGIKVIVDIVPNHTSTEHEWFKAALAAGPGSPERDRYIFRPGRGENGELPPNGWKSTFGGPGWEPVGDGEWYLHLFAVEQADLNWKNPEVREDFKKTLRFWSDRGADGFRIDVAHALAKDLDSRPLDEWPDNLDEGEPGDENPLWDRPEVHEIYREWRQVFNEYEPARFAVAEAWVVPEHQWMYASTDELGQVFNFELSKAGWFADELRRAIEEGLDAAERSGSTTTWVLSNHDMARHPTRYGLPQVRSATHHQLVNDWLLRDGTTYYEDRELGTRRARAALLMELGLPGSVYLYQGEELGLFEVADIPWDALEDPEATMTSHGDAIKGRDGCRVPLPWRAVDETGDFGFSAPADHKPAHLPQPAWFAQHAVDIEETEKDSMLKFYRRALSARAELLTATGDTSLSWADGYDDQVIAYTRPTADGRALTSVTNFGPEPVKLPAGEVLLASAPLNDGKLPTDTTAWVIR